MTGRHAATDDQANADGELADAGSVISDGTVPGDADLQVDPETAPASGREPNGDAPDER